MHLRGGVFEFIKKCLVFLLLFTLVCISMERQEIIPRPVSDADSIILYKTSNKETFALPSIMKDLFKEISPISQSSIEVPDFISGKHIQYLTDVVRAMITSGLTIDDFHKPSETIIRTWCMSEQLFGSQVGIDVKKHLDFFKPVALISHYIGYKLLQAKIGLPSWFLLETDGYKDALSSIKKEMIDQKFFYGMRKKILAKISLDQVHNKTFYFGALLFNEYYKSLVAYVSDPFGYLVIENVWNTEKNIPDFDVYQKGFVFSFEYAADSHFASSIWDVIRKRKLFIQSPTFFKYITYGCINDYASVIAYCYFVRDKIRVATIDLTAEKIIDDVQQFDISKSFFKTTYELNTSTLETVCWINDHTILCTIQDIYSFYLDNYENAGLLKKNMIVIDMLNETGYRIGSLSLENKVLSARILDSMLYVLYAENASKGAAKSLLCIDIKTQEMLYKKSLDNIEQLLESMIDSKDAQIYSMGLQIYNDDILINYIISTIEKDLPIFTHVNVNVHAFVALESIPYLPEISMIECQWLNYIFNKSIVSSTEFERNIIDQFMNRYPLQDMPMLKKYLKDKKISNLLKK